MKRIWIATLLTIVWWLVLYGLGCITVLSWSLHAWEPVSRGVAALFGFAGTIAIWVGCYQELKQ